MEFKPNPGPIKLGLIVSDCKIASAVVSQKNLKITIVISSDRIFSQMLDETASKIILLKAKEK